MGFFFLEFGFLGKQKQAEAKRQLSTTTLNINRSIKTSVGQEGGGVTGEWRVALIFCLL